MIGGFWKISGGFYPGITLLVIVFIYRCGIAPEQKITFSWLDVGIGAVLLEVYQKVVLENHLTV
jgi:hypothetical protein